VPNTKSRFLIQVFLFHLLKITNYKTNFPSIYGLVKVSAERRTKPLECDVFLKYAAVTKGCSATPPEGGNKQINFSQGHLADSLNISTLVSQ
jgi:hypothetical protein